MSSVSSGLNERSRVELAQGRIEREQEVTLDLGIGRSKVSQGWASLAQRFPASSVLAREGAGCGSESLLRASQLHLSCRSLELSGFLGALPVC